MKIFLVHKAIEHFQYPTFVREVCSVSLCASIKYLAVINNNYYSIWALRNFVVMMGIAMHESKVRL